MDTFFTRYNIDPLAFDRCGLKWDTLEEIREQYRTVRPELEAAARESVQLLMSCGKVHSINYRIKEPDHLIEKIIRKTLEDPSRDFSVANYSEKITDLIGIRILHLFKEDWLEIHSYLMNNWNMIEAPTAYYRHGDSPRILEHYRRNDCRIQENPYGYRSVHYHVETRRTDPGFSAELQVRTLFEEAWGEIDHIVRYPYFADNEMLVRLSSILNKLAGDADELGTYMLYLKNRTRATETEHQQEIRQKNRLIDDLRKQIDSLAIDSEQKTQLTDNLNELEQQQPVPATTENEFPWLDTFVDSPLFKTLSRRLDKFVAAQMQDPIPITEEENRMLQNAQQELMRLLGDPEKLKEALNDEESHQLLKELEGRLK